MDECAASCHLVLVGYLRVALVHLVWLQHVVNAAAERYLSVGFLYAVEIALDGVVHDLLVFGSDPATDFTGREHHHLLLLVGNDLFLGH